MILDFRPSDMTTFRATFNSRELAIHKQHDNSWKLFVNNRSVKNSQRDTARKCMLLAETAAQRVVNEKIEQQRKVN